MNRCRSGCAESAPQTAQARVDYSRVMMKFLKVLGVFMVSAFAIGAAAWWMIGGAVGIVESQLPSFPDWPEPATQLSESDADEIFFASHSPYDFDILLRANPMAVPTTGIGTLILPRGASSGSPVPAVVLVHGSGGISPGREMEAGQALADAGIAAFVIDYYSPRGVNAKTDYMAKVLAVTEFDAVADAYGALRILSTHPALDASRMGVMGFSYGGMAVRLAMDERVRKALLPEHPGFAAFADAYGPCFQDWGTTSVNGAPLLTQRGTEDRSNDLAACAEREADLAALGVAVDARIYEGAGHAWEAETPRQLFEDSPYVAGCTIWYDAKGHSFLGDTPIVTGPVSDSRAERVVQRLASGGPMADCVGSGYLIGRDDATRAKAQAVYLEFFRGVFGLALRVQAEAA